MAITRRPTQTPSSHVNVEALINKGGSVAREPSEPPPSKNGKPAAVVVRIPGEELARIDQLVGARRVRTTRHTWLLEAIAEKIDREKSE